jgi:hypothetical protein
MMSDSPIEKAAKNTSKRQFLGDMVGTAEILGDIVSPVIDMEEIEACWELEIISL